MRSPDGAASLPNTGNNTNMTNRTNDVGRAFLHWFGEHADRDPNPEEFLNDAPEIDGVPITEAELTKAVLRAEHYGMLRGLRGDGRSMPLRIRMLPPGQECLDDFDGDMRKWNEAQRGTSTVTTDNSVHVTARDNATVMAHAQDAVQNVSATSINADRLREVGQAAQEIVDVLPRPIREEVEQAGKDLVRAADDPDDVEQVKSAGQRLLDLLSGSSASLVIVRFVIDVLTGALGGS